MHFFFNINYELLLKLSSFTYFWCSTRVYPRSFSNIPDTGNILCPPGGGKGHFSVQYPRNDAFDAYLTWIVGRAAFIARVSFTLSVRSFNGKPINSYYVVATRFGSVRYAVQRNTSFWFLTSANRSNYKFWVSVRDTNTLSFVEFQGVVSQ